MECNACEFQTAPLPKISLLTSANPSGINNLAAVAASVTLTESEPRLTRGDLGQLAPRKKLLKSWQSFPEVF